MNILFTTEKKVSPYKGGTERITDTLCQAFRKLGNNVYLSYVVPDSEQIENDHFCSIFRWDISNDLHKSIEQTISDNHIDYVICNYVSFSVKKRIMPELLELSHSYGAKLIFCFHAMPGEDLIGAGIDNALYRIKHHYDQRQAVKDLILSFTPQVLQRHYLKKKYRFYLNNCDKLVLLSESFFDTFANIAGASVDYKFRAIPNALSFPLQAIDYKEEKKREVLIVARLHERSKRLSHALKIWKEIEKNGGFDDWTLNIVGGGMDENYYKEMSNSLGLSNVVFWGRQESLEPFYRRASICMMTSAFEGFGITLTEAQQFGAVPIAYSSFSSIGDIITSGHNGILVKNADIIGFSKELMKLMNDSVSREKYSINSQESVRAFLPDGIAERWIDLLTKE